MITAVDTNVLLDVLGPDPVFGPASANAVRRAIAEGELAACEVVWAEVAANFHSSGQTEHATSRLGLGFCASTSQTALKAGELWKVYRNRGGQRRRVIADFLIRAHALHQADRLLTRDRGFYRAYFKHFSILDPSKQR